MARSSLRAASASQARGQAGGSNPNTTAGTPSNLVPLELGNCNYEKGADGQMMNYLMDPRIVSFQVRARRHPASPARSLGWLQVVEAGWSARALLDRICTANPTFHALIDTGALITGMTNLGQSLPPPRRPRRRSRSRAEVAQYLATHGHPAEGIVFLDEKDRKARPRAVPRACSRRAHPCR